jgi:hypothetical protein
MNKKAAVDIELDGRLFTSILWGGIMILAAQ